MEKRFIVRTLVLAMTAAQGLGCSGPLLRTADREASRSIGATEAGKQASAPTSEDSAADLAEGKRNARKAWQNTAASAEYHFSMAQAYVAEGNPDRAIEEYKLALMFDPRSPLLYARLATEYVKKGMLTAAMEACKEALQRDPEYVDARLLLAGLHSTLHENDSALVEYDRILAKNPKHEEAVIYKAQVLTEEGKVLAATQSLTRFVARVPDSALGWYYLGRTEQRQDHHQKAAAALLKALEIRPGFSQAALALGYLYEETGLVAKAVAVYRDLFESTQDLSAANRLSMIYLKQEKYREAAPYLETIRASDPDDLNARVKLGLIQMELKQFDQAIRTFNEILAKNPESDRIHYYLGSIYEETGKPAQAIEALKKVASDSKLHGDAVLHASYLLKQEKRIAEAKALIREAIKKSPKNPGFHVFQASLEEETGNPRGAIEILKGAVTRFPEDEKVRYYLGSLYDRQGDQDRALEQMEAILTFSADNVDALNYIGYTWTLQGVRLSDAEKLLRKAMALSPGNGFIQDSWGYYLFVRGRTREAIVELEKAAKLKPDEATILEHLADAYLRANLREKALDQYREASQYAQEEGAKRKLQEKADQLAREIAERGGRTDRTPAAEPAQGREKD